MNADSGARVRVEADPARPGQYIAVIERPKRTRRLYLAADEAEQLRVALNRALPEVTVRRVS